MALADLNNSPRCQHVHYSGRPCKAPARRGRNYCIFHQAAHLDPGGCVLPIIEDVHSYQLAVVRIARALADDVIDSRKATALLYALQLAGAKLDDLVRLRADIENPTRALHNELSERYHARRYPFPAHIPEKDLLPILKEILSERPAEPSDNVAIVPQTPVEPDLPSSQPNGGCPTHRADTPPVTSPSPERDVWDEPRPEPQSIDPSSGLRPPQDDKGFTAGAA